MATYRVGRWWQARARELQAMGYHIQWSILNAKHHGAPQNRPRLWVVCIRRDTLADGSSFTMPEPLPPQLSLSLADILNPPGAEDGPRALPRAQSEALNVSRAQLKAKERNIVGD